MAVETTPRLGIPRWPLGTDPYRREHRNLTSDQLEALVAVATKGLAADRPAFGGDRRFYFATDTGALSFDTGTGWLTFATVNGNGRVADSEKLAGLLASSLATADTVMRRDASGRSSVVDPTAASHVATKGYVDTGLAGKLATGGTAANSTLLAGLAPSAAATADTVMRRDGNGRASVVDPTSASHIASKGYADTGDAARVPLVGKGPIGAIVTALTDTSTSGGNYSGALVPLEANRDYLVTIVGTYESSALTTGIRLRLAGPTGASFVGHARAQVGAAGPDAFHEDTLLGSGEFVTSGVNVINTPRGFQIQGVMSMGGTAGNMQLRVGTEVAGSQVTFALAGIAAQAIT